MRTCCRRAGGAGGGQQRSAARQPVAAAGSVAYPLLARPHHPQYRMDKNTCVYRNYLPVNKTNVMDGNLYQAEPGGREAHAARDPGSSTRLRVATARLRYLKLWASLPGWQGAPPPYREHRICPRARHSQACTKPCCRASTARWTRRCALVCVARMAAAPARVGCACRTAKLEGPAASLAAGSRFFLHSLLRGLLYFSHVWCAER